MAAGVSIPWSIVSALVSVSMESSPCTPLQMMPTRPHTARSCRRRSTVVVAVPPSPQRFFFITRARARGAPGAEGDRSAPPVTKVPAAPNICAATLVWLFRIHVHHRPPRVRHPDPHPMEQGPVAAVTASPALSTSTLHGLHKQPVQSRAAPPRHRGCPAAALRPPETPHSHSAPTEAL